MSKIQHSVTPEIGRFDFDGKCAPHNAPHSSFENFRLGIFQWEAKNGARGKAGQVKRTKIFRHVIGKFSDPQKAYDHARDLCARYNDGRLTPPLSHATEAAPL